MHNGALGINDVLGCQHHQGVVDVNATTTNISPDIWVLLLVAFMKINLKKATYKPYGGSPKENQIWGMTLRK